MFRVLRDRTYRRLYAAQIIALLGTGLLTVALGLLSYDIAGDEAGVVMGTALAIKMIAYVIVSPIATTFFSRFSRKKVLVGADLIRFAAALSLPFIDQVWQIFVLIFLLQSASAVFTPTFQSVIPDILPDEDDYTSALSLSRLAYDLEAIVSPMLAAAALLIISSNTLFFGTAAGFIGSALLVVSVLIPRPRFDEADPKNEEPFLRRAAQGILVFLRSGNLRPVLAVNLAVAASGAFIIVQTVVVVRSTLGLDQSAVAWMLGANGLGSMVAAMALPAILRRQPEKRVIVAGMVLTTITTALIVPVLLNIDQLGVLAVPTTATLWLLIGFGWSTSATPLPRIIRRSVPDRDLVKTFAGQFSLSHLAWLPTYSLVGWVGAKSLPLAAAVMTALILIGLVATLQLWPQEDASHQQGRSETMEA